MSKYEQKEGDIAIFLEDLEGNRPLFKGTALVDGQKRDIALWPKKDTSPDSIQRAHAGLKGVGITMFRGVIAINDYKPSEQGSGQQEPQDEISF